MIYSNPEFFVLFFLTLAAFSLSRAYTARFSILLAASLIFYSWAGFFDLAVFLSVVVVSWLSTLGAEKFPLYKRPFIFFGISVMAAHLFFWKYAAWVTGQIQAVSPTFLGGEKLSFALPVGISFFTLQGIAYLVDLSRGEARFIPFRDYLLFKAFFPQLVAGPIVRVPQLLPQLRVLSRPAAERIISGAFLFGLGFFKKLAVADNCAIYADNVFANPGAFDRFSLLTAALGYTIQIWADFSGYTDMGRGAARMLGIELPENFRSPYFARSPSDFWRRWHITLSQWIRDYIYIPLGGSKGGLLRVTAVAMLTMGISGLWHGANWTFVLWGLYHGALLAFERLAGARGRERPAGEGFTASRMFSSLATFAAVVFGWILFRSESLSSFNMFVSGLISGAGEKSADVPYLLVYACAAFCVAAHAIHERLRARTAARSQAVPERNSRAFVIARGLAAGAALAAVFALAISLRYSTGGKAFIYFTF